MARIYARERRMANGYSKKKCRRLGAFIHDSTISTPLLTSNCSAFAFYENRLVRRTGQKNACSRLAREPAVLKWRGSGAIIEIVPVVSSKDTREVVAPYLDGD
jgi:hypothetical protein